MPDATLSFDHLVTLLQDAEARFRIIHHPAEGTSEAVARIRGTDPGQGAKAMLCQIKELPETLVLAILPGNLKIDFRKVAESVGGKKASLVSPAIAKQRTGCEIGAIPPFVVAPSITLIAEPQLFEQFDEIAFNVGGGNPPVHSPSEEPASRARTSLSRRSQSNAGPGSFRSVVI